MTRTYRTLLRIGRACVALLMATVVASCSTDGYDTGDGRYSYLKADFCKAHVTADMTVDYILTDGGDSVRLAKPTTVGWAPAKDTLWRALAYYDNATKKLFSLSQVLVARPLAKMSIDSVATDPLTLESAWMGGGFLNIGFAVKAGATDQMEATQAIGIMVDSIETEGEATRAVTLRLLHAQNNVPQYYTVRNYLSMPLPTAWRGAKMTVVANTYSGEQRLTAE